MKVYPKSLFFILIASLVSATPLFGAASVKDDRGNHRLISAAKSADTESVRLLISQGADVNVKDEKGYNAFLYAVESGCAPVSKNADLIELLVKKGADIHAKTPEGETALDMALACRQGSLLRDLLNAGVNLWAPAPGKARVFFIDNGLKVDMHTAVGDKSKYIGKDGGVVFMDVEPGTYPISAKSPSSFYHSVAAFKSPVKASSGDVYYFRIAELEGEHWDYILSLVRDKQNYPVKIVPLTETEAKKEIRKILKLQESGEETKSAALVPDEKAKTDHAAKAPAPVMGKHADTSAEVTQPAPPAAAKATAKDDRSGFFQQAQILRELKKLKDEGLLTDKEYEQKRKAIIDSM